jgi:hypothetical protein
MIWPKYRKSLFGGFRFPGFTEPFVIVWANFSAHVLSMMHSGKGMKIILTFSVVMLELASVFA